MSVKKCRQIIVFAFILLSLASLITAYAATSPRITISALNISKALTFFPLNGETWEIDPWEKGIGHLEYTGWFDGPGNIVLAAHSRMPDGSAGVFANLDNLSAGEVIILFDGEAERQYTVIDVRIVPFDDVSVVYPTAGEQVTLITCDTGSYDAASGTYSERVVVVAERAG